MRTKDLHISARFDSSERSPARDPRVVLRKLLGGGRMSLPEIRDPQGHGVGSRAAKSKLFDDAVTSIERITLALRGARAGSFSDLPLI